MSCIRALQTRWQTVRTETERRRVTVLVATPAFHQYKSQSEELEQWLVDMETRAKAAEGDADRMKVGG